MVSFVWDEQQQNAFEKIKQVLSSPMTMTMPVKGQLMMLYLTSTFNFIGALLVQKVEGRNDMCTKLSRYVRDSELNYPQWRSIVLL